MTSKKFKSIMSLLLSIVLIFTICLSNFSFATVSSNNEIIYSQKYYVRNKQTGLYMGGVDYTSIVQTAFEPNTD